MGAVLSVAPCPVGVASPRDDHADGREQMKENLVEGVIALGLPLLSAPVIISNYQSMLSQSDFSKL